ncbi:eye-specific diacylglycerol kinase-like isoform X3 [Macrosteles quadrilineatus]|uniref:eye-specific diacylglycerol kinase-like isoform X3 n=1 Tax=Macrosteles quadrilineatus TaxID=74068 RepID=UPI0023E09921|nr:eye-specific diacylglycerol kinase-like isoform X3 [Macrosteles quadrilineatus]
MQRLRTTFKRSRTPTGAEMKTQSSLEVPKQVRSASFDEIQLEAKRSLQHQTSESGGFLSVPAPSQRSKSFDGGGGEGEASAFLEVPRPGRFQRRRSSGDKSPPPCIHCIYMEEYWRSRSPSGEDSPHPRSFSYSDTSTEDEVDSDPEPPARPQDLDLEPPLTPLTPQCCITVTLSPNPVVTSPTLDEPPPSPSSRRRSITSPKLERQEAFIFNENLLDPNIPLDVLTPDEPPPSPAVPNALIVSEFFLAVPELKRDRAASVDSCFINKSGGSKTEEIPPPSDTQLLLEPPPLGPNALRSRSVDIVLPTDTQARYKALAMTNNSQPRTGDKGKAVQSGGGGGDGDSGTAQRSIRSTPDWSETAVNGDHLWSPTNASGDFCYVGEGDCTKQGSRMKCSACKIVAHSGCISVLMERVKFTCKPTFRDVGVRQYREQTCIHHHWVHRRSQKGKCKQCGKSFQSKLSFSSKEIVALSCSWCKTAYHNKESCFNLQKIGEECSLGHHVNIIVPPSWIVKLPRRGSFKSSLRKSPKKKPSSKKRSKEKIEKDPKTFVIKPIPTANVRPVIVFINPKSGGNQGVKLLQKFQWLLNPRQVFDLTQGGPKMGLELFRKVPNLRVLACGGDGTAGWVLSILDQLSFTPPPAVGVLPLGTGNDLARALGWGGGYTDEPISKILANIGDSEVINLDRWQLTVEKNSTVEPNEEGKESLPLNVVNNYFSLGVDAHIALEFHEAREAHPERFNSRLRNKMFYGQMGGKDLLRRKWKGLADLVTLECDGKDMTPKLKEHKVHAIVFLNIPSYGGGTHPWNRAQGVEQATDDGMIEVVGLTTYQLPLLQAGGHGTTICQCQSAKIVTTKTIPMQVDGEACKLNPSIITMNLLNKAPMLAKRRGGKPNVPQATLDQLRVTVYRISMADYEQHHYDKTLLKQAEDQRREPIRGAIKMGEIEVAPVADLEQVRQMVNKLQENSSEPSENCPKLSPDWCFVDSCTAERFFRVDRAQEHLHYLTDIANDALYVLDTLPQTPDDETAFLSPVNSNHQSPSSLPGEQTTPELSPSEESPKRPIDLELESSPPQRPPRSPPSSPALGTLPSSALGTPSSPPPSPPPEPPIDGSPVAGTTNYISNLLEKTSDGIVRAAKNGDLKMLKDLHGQGFSLLSIDASGQTALHHGAKYGHKDIVKYLIACAPASILNMADNDKGQTALHKAAQTKRRSICCMLVAGGASLTMQDRSGATPRQLAVQADDQDLAAYLEKLSAENVINYTVNRLGMLQNQVNRKLKRKTKKSR